MSTLEEHEAEQAAITAMCEAGTCDHPECHMGGTVTVDTSHFISVKVPDGMHRDDFVNSDAFFAAIAEIVRGGGVDFEIMTSDDEGD